jgi:phosphohistidine phosphatase
MKRIVLMRHGKAESIAVDDFSRNLTAEGRRNNVEQFKKMQQTNDFIPIESIITSSAYRCLQTAEMAARHFNILSIQTSAKMYSGDIDNYYSEIFTVNDTINSIIVVGHNPTISYLIQEYDTSFLQYLKTSAMAIIDFEIDSWLDITDKSPQKILYI